MATYLPGARTSTMWARHEPAGMKHGKTDHWTKMKHKNTTFKVAMPGVKIIEKQAGESFQVNEDGTFSHMPGKPFDEGLEEALGDNKPGKYQETRPRRRVSIPNMKVYRNQFNDRAREGFQYWPKTRPKPTLYGKYGMGSFKSVLGLGDAVRT